MIASDQQFSNKSYIVIDVDEYPRLEVKQIISAIKSYVASGELLKLQKYDDYYQSYNQGISKKVKDKGNRNITPNNLVPTAYFTNVVDTLSGYMFSDVQYNTDSDDFLTVLEENNINIKDMNNGVRALAYNKAIELIYTEGKEKDAKIKISHIDPRQMILIYDTGIEPEIFCGIWLRRSHNDREVFLVDVIYKDEWQYYNYQNEKLWERKPSFPLYHDECPVVYYYADDMANQSVFEKIIPYIDTLDFLISGNANDLEKLADSILILTKILQDDDLRHLDELKAIMDITSRDGEIAPYYLEKNMNPAFREYATKVIIQEIHKQSHVIDWYSPDTGISGEVSAKAMKTRLFDMNMYSKRLEMVYRVGAEKRARLVNKLLATKRLKPADDLEIVYNRTLPDDFIENLVALNSVTYISDTTKYEILGIDVQIEQERLEEQKNANMERMSLQFPDSDNEQENDEKEVDDNA